MTMVLFNQMRDYPLSVINIREIAYFLCAESTSFITTVRNSTYKNALA